MLMRTQFLRQGEGKGQRSRSLAPRENATESLGLKVGRTGRSPSGEDDRASCLDYKNGACKRGRDCDHWHPPHWRDLKSKGKRGWGCPFVHPRNQTGPRRPRRRSRGNANSQEGAAMSITRIAKEPPENLPSKEQTCRKQRTLRTQFEECSLKRE